MQFGLGNDASQPLHQIKIKGSTFGILELDDAVAILNSDFNETISQQQHQQRAIVWAVLVSWSSSRCSFSRSLITRILIH